MKDIELSLRVEILILRENVHTITFIERSRCNRALLKKVKAEQASNATTCQRTYLEINIR